MNEVLTVENVEKGDRLEKINQDGFHLCYYEVVLKWKDDKGRMRLILHRLLGGLVDSSQGDVLGDDDLAGECGVRWRKMPGRKEPQA